MLDWNSETSTRKSMEYTWEYKLGKELSEKDPGHLENKIPNRQVRFHEIKRLHYKRNSYSTEKQPIEWKFQPRIWQRVYREYTKISKIKHQENKQKVGYRTNQNFQKKDKMARKCFLKHLPSLAIKNSSWNYFEANFFFYKKCWRWSGEPLCTICGNENWC